jgi:tRNA modification GTPase
MRDVEDEVESEGVRRARAAREQADLVVLVLEAGRAIHDAELEALTRLEDAGGAERGRTLVVVNKSDLERALDEPLPHPDAIRISARTGLGLDELRQALRERLVGTGPLEHPILSDARHGAALEKTRSAVDRAAEALASGLSEELVLEDLREAMASLGEITGEFAADDLYERIFSSFCIGK